MEKISQIVRGSARVASVDLKSAPAVRPGMPSFGRSVGEAPASPGRESTTASRAAALHAQLTDQRRSSSERTIDQMADQFFMSRIRRPESMEETVEVGAGEVVSSQPHEGNKVSAASEETLYAENEVAAEPAPKGYTPRGSFIDVRA